MKARIEPWVLLGHFVLSDWTWRNQEFLIGIGKIAHDTARDTMFIDAWAKEI